MSYNSLLWHLENAFEFYVKTDVCIKDLSDDFYSHLLHAVTLIRNMSGCVLDLPCNAVTHPLGP
jgi:hypothetical protein